MHTPGPWKAEMFGGSIPSFRMWEVRIAPLTGIKSNNNRILCGVDQEDNHEMEANARLIAAAPKLLEALEGLVKEFPGIAASPTDASKQATATIAEAKEE